MTSSLMADDIYWRREWLKENLYLSLSLDHKWVYISATTSEVNFCIGM
jgi:hypothetical protein